MKVLLSLFVLFATSSAALSANIPLGYDCTSDLQSICEGDNNPSPSPEPTGGGTQDGVDVSVSEVDG